jgi:hypothetical protein
MSNLLHQYEQADDLLLYHYDVHTWEWGGVFWLVGDKWCKDLSGKQPVGVLDELQELKIKKLAPVIRRNEKENRQLIDDEKQM